MTSSTRAGTSLTAGDAQDHRHRPRVPAGWLPDLAAHLLLAPGRAGRSGPRPWPARTGTSPRPRPVGGGGRPDGRPVPLGPEFHRLYGAAAQGRSASVRLSHPRPPHRPRAGRHRCGPATWAPSGSVNNAIHWAAVEDISPAWTGCRTAPNWRVTSQCCPGCDPYLAASPRSQVSLWLLDGAPRLFSARLSRLVEGGRGQAVGRQASATFSPWRPGVALARPRRPRLRQLQLRRRGSGAAGPFGAAR